MTALHEQKQQLLERWRREEFDPTLIEIFAKVPREQFVPEELQENAYIDRPLPIGFDQTISQPTTILIMLQLLELRPKLRVLEIGAGSGYVCALMATLGCSLVGIEIIPELAIEAARRMAALGLDDQVRIYAADGGNGWEQEAPYDRILISAAAPTIPRHLLWQLKDRGILVAPVGAVEQQMIVFRKRGEDIVEEDHGTFLFTPLRGKYGVENGGEVPGLPFV
jgi:protein-L-isoaspartate(D-aspartate) O-methyltransferase